MNEVDSNQIAEWKSKYGEIFAIDDCIFRSLTINEHKALTIHREWDIAEAEDYIVKTTLLYPEFSFLETKAGFITTLAEEILNLSGYGEVQFAKEKMTEARERCNEVINLMKIFIIAAIPAYNDEDLDRFTFAQLSFKVALAEQIITVRQGGSTLELIDPEEEAIKQKTKIEQELANKKPGQAISMDPIAQRLHAGLG